MLVAAVIGLLWGAMLGPRFSVGVVFFDTIRMVAPIVAILLMSARIYWREASFRVPLWSLMTLSMTFIWSFVHSPSPLLNHPPPVIVHWASGCGVSNDELIVENGGNIYSAKGAALTGDVVSTRTGSPIGNRSLVVVKGALGDSGVICAVASAMRRWAQVRILRFPPDVAAWLQAFVTGDQSSIGKDLSRTFKEVGLLHVLVLSGGHLSVVASVFLMAMRFLHLIPYILRNLSVQVWVRVWTLTNFLVMLPLFVFCLMVGFSQSIQRAFFGAFIVLILPMMGIASSVKSRILATFFLQAVFFPVNILSMSMILSWSGSLLLMAFFESTYLKGWIWSLGQLLKIQILFFGMSLLFFGSAGVLSPFANLVGQFVFGGLLPFNIIAIVMPLSWLDPLVVYLNRTVLLGVNSIALLQRMMPVGFVKIPSGLTADHIAGRCAILITLSVFFWFSLIRQKKPRPFWGEA